MPCHRFVMPAGAICEMLFLAFSLLRLFMGKNSCRTLTSVLVLPFGLKREALGCVPCL